MTIFDIFHDERRYGSVVDSRYQWINMLIETGFIVERIAEPRPTEEAVRQCPHVRDARIVPHFLHVRVRKPAG